MKLSKRQNQSKNVLESLHLRVSDLSWPKQTGCGEGGQGQERRRRKSWCDREEERRRRTRCDREEEKEDTLD